MAAPSTALDMTRTYSVASAVIHYKGGEQKTVPLEYHILYHNTDKVGTNTYEAGRLYDAFGNPLTDPFGEPLIAENSGRHQSVRDPGCSVERERRRQPVPGDPVRVRLAAERR